MSPQGDSVTASINKDRLDELPVLTEELTQSNVCSFKSLRSYTGKAQSMASVLHVWRPFISMLWGAMFADGKSNAPRGCLWTSQISEPLIWIKAFLEQTAGSLHRTFLVSTHYNRGDKIVVYVDASPWGIGGWILVDGRPLGYFADGINDMDRAVLSLSDEPGSESPQALECWPCLLRCGCGCHSERNSV